MCLHLDGEEGLTVEFGMWIVVLELLDGPPCRSAVCDVAAKTFRHTGVEDGDHTTIASEDERARVALCREVAGHLIVVVDSHFDRPFTRLIAKVGLQSRIVSHREVSGVAIFPNDVKGIPVLIKTVRSS